MSSTLVTYYIQGELGESLEIPNGFMINIPNSTQFSFGQFLKEFPLPNSNDFHFRFRMDDKHCDYSWLDVTKISQYYICEVTSFGRCRSNAASF